MRKKLAALMMTGAIALAPIQPVHAQFGFGGIVFDPSNYAENVLTAARTLEQINNQIKQLQNEAQMLINQARNLASLPHSSLAQLQTTIAHTQHLLNEAQNIAYQVSEIETAFNEQYGEAAANGDFADMIANAEARWRTSVAGYEDALKIQAGVVGNIERARTELSNLVAQSQGATGALQATQAGNQLLALQSQQMTDLTAAIAAQNRAQALDAARRASAEAQARENLNRFLDYGSDYAPTTVTMFR
ncbi:P-type conjugative transfer protein TrbJ [Pelagibacterium halotolerans]|uniref:Conjugative transfer protein TrbJ n=1 Tax=Pelagibacterium halotolerans (strain DSM 22347 / JCM 15775 / CGMCC 1.7692 / B2) TaxID=1082931 RepID=G4RAT5_PELHB|nr:P-type conjugative transfer protein TrbJ [Pelagibacterium halotolerans]AEQ53571.1 conjugative transfer protein TrbJ [Pelagibacterium halotolerans B2]QJR20255.1 P-type conjugative transfer protein TrbJ [Pelagibacterium halotolerans]SEA57248.1 P-type conjugative transfer protein TrbJ [Pelagibacterium halotolerans]